MKKIIKFLTICIAIILIIAFCIIIYKITYKKSDDIQETSTEPVISEIEEDIPVEWHGKYIWNNDMQNNTWNCFRKKFNIESEDFGKVKAQIAVDSKYWLYINGEMVIREGGEKRGQKPASIYYDNIDITKYLKQGENTIAILTWYWGDSGYSYIPSGRGGLLFQAKIDNQYIITDETWKVSHADGFEQDPNIPNYRLVEYNIYYDARKEVKDWYMPEFNDEKWENALYVGEAGGAPWGEMIERDIPIFKNWDLKEYENMDNYRDYKTTKSEEIEMLIGYNAQFMPYLKIESEPGKKIIIKTDQYEDVNGNSLMCTYFTKEGIQEFESPAWINGEKVYYNIPSGVKIISLGYRETGYDTEMTGKFECNDEFYNELWKKANRTLYVNMRDTYMDCPNRERAQWWGDVSIDVIQAMYALDTNSYALYEKGLKTLAGWCDNDELQTVTPVSDSRVFLPIQMLAGIDSIYEFYQYTGNKTAIEGIYPYIKNFLNLWEFDNITGRYKLKEVNSIVWKWEDSGKKIDYDLEENMWYYFALTRMCQISEILDYQEDNADYINKRNSFIPYLNNLWTEKGFKSPYCDEISERANAVAVISGLADKEKFEVITNMFKDDYQTSPFMEKYILEALCKMGKIEEAQKRIKDRYDEMVNSEKACSTLWENWNYEISSKNHAWSGGPLIIMSRYFAGIEPLEKGYDIISVKPQFGELNKISAVTTTIKGDIKLDAEKKDGSLHINLETPSKTRIAIEKIGENAEILINEDVVYKNKKPKKVKNIIYDNEDEKYVYFYIESGKYEINSN